MSKNPSIQVLDEYLQTPQFDAFKRELTAAPVGGEGNFTIGEIFENDPVRLNAFLESEYLQQQAEQGDEQALALVDSQDIEIANAVNTYLQRYLPLDDVEQTRLSLDTPPRPVALGREEGLPTDITTSFGQPPSDYGRLTENVLTSEEDRQNLVSLGVDPDVIYQGDQNFYEKYMQGQFPTGSIDKDSPWRVKAFFFPINMTPFEAEKLLEQESPNAEFRYINPRDKSMGLAIRDESTNGRFVPLRPQFGLEAGTCLLYTSPSPRDS